MVNSKVDMLYLDFAKGLDKVDHEMVSHRLRRLREWLHNFLKNRSQYVAADGTISRSTLITSDVSQGTVPEPLLFVVTLPNMPATAKTA